MEGWIKLHRSSFDHWLYKTNKPKSRREAWEDMIVLANYEPKKVLIRGQLYLCDRGQSLLSLESWAKQFNWSVQMVRTFFGLLEKDEMITLEGLQYTTRLTICNYDSYQGSSTDEKHTNQQTANMPLTDQQQTANMPLTDQQQTANMPLTTTKESKEVKNIKKVKNKDIEIPSLEIFIDFILQNDSTCTKQGIALKYKSWVENGWKDGYNKSIVNWKSKALNIIQYLPKYEVSVRPTDKSNINEKWDKKLAELQALEALQAKQ